MTKRIGFIGVGLMGHGMARNLVEKAFFADDTRASEPPAGGRFGAP